MKIRTLALAGALLLVVNVANAALTHTLKGSASFSGGVFGDSVDGGTVIPIPNTPYPFDTLAISIEVSFDNALATGSLSALVLSSFSYDVGDRTYTLADNVGATQLSFLSSGFQRIMVEILPDPHLITAGGVDDFVVFFDVSTSGETILRPTGLARGDTVGAFWRTPGVSTPPDSFSVSAIPEPSAYVTILVGLIFVGAMRLHQSFG